MRGSIRQRGKTYQLQVYTGMGPDGKPQRHYETVRGRKGDAQRRLTELLSSMDKGVYTPPGKLTVKNLCSQWLEGYVKTNCSQRTLDGYQSIVERHLAPVLGHIQLKSLHPQQIQAYYGQAVASGLSARTVHHQHRVLNQALKYAVRQGYLGRNPAEMVDPPRPRNKTMRTLTPNEVEQLLNSVKESYYYPVIYTAVSSGLRQAELLGLRWRDVDPDITMSISVNQVLYIRKGVCQFKEPKTEHSRRRVSMTPKLACYLREYKLSRVRLYHELEKELTLDALVFSSVEGKPIDARVMSHAFNRMVRKAGLAGVRFHDLRHTFASLMLMRGAKPKVISEALGHASVGFTLQVYSHIIEGMQEDAMSLLDGVLPAGVSVPNNVKTTSNPSFMVSVN